MDNSQDTTKSVLSVSQVIPLSHATMLLTMGGQVIYVDPVGGAEIFTGQPNPSLILVSDIHSDHFDLDTLKAVAKDDTVTIVPQAVADQLSEPLPGQTVILKNGDSTTQKGITIEAVPMYNIPESPDTFHNKGRGNGYIINVDSHRVYIAGDTSATPEMKELQNIDEAFVPMNLPYTMDEEEAANGVLAFKPRVVHPYHYRGQSGLSDINKFKELVETKDPNIKVELLEFYPKQ